MEDIAIQVRQLTVAYHTKVILHTIDLDFKRGKITAIIGPNGAGKSTLIKAMLDIEPRLTGKVGFSLSTGASFSPYSKVQKEVAYIPQSASVDWDFPMSVGDAVVMGRYGRLGWFKRPGKKDWELARMQLERVGLSDYIDHQIGQLSGGQRQRVFMARALAQEAEIYILDEPFSGVDMQSEEIILKILKRLASQGKSVILVHHDLQTVKAYFDEVVFLNRQVIATGPVETTLTDETIYRAYHTNEQVFEMSDDHE